MMTSHLTDLSETLFSNSDLVFYTDGPAYRKNGVPCAGYAICGNFSITESTALPSSSAAQVAELHALERACHLAKRQTVTIYTDSIHAFRCLHNYLHLFAVVNCEAHTKSKDPGSRGNALADHTAKPAAKIDIPVLVKLCSFITTNGLASTSDVLFSQESADLKRLSHGC